jgi:carboxymethylenebutenolidase
MGGGYALDVALEEPTLAADVINHGHLATEPRGAEENPCLILGLFGGQDQGISPDDVHKFEASLKQLGKKVDIKIYDDAGHGFENPNNQAGYRPDDAADAWKRTVSFLAENLKK